jgi:hypothetical protein
MSLFWSYFASNMLEAFDEIWTTRPNCFKLHEWILIYKTECSYPINILGTVHFSTDKESNHILGEEWTLQLIYTYLTERFMFKNIQVFFSQFQGVSFYNRKLKFLWPCTIVITVNTLTQCVKWYNIIGSTRYWRTVSLDKALSWWHEG